MFDFDQKLYATHFEKVGVDWYLPTSNQNNLVFPIPNCILLGTLFT
jgi:hypothetical protein